MWLFIWHVYLKVMLCQPRIIHVHTTVSLISLTSWVSTFRSDIVPEFQTGNLLLYYYLGLSKARPGVVKLPDYGL